MLDKLFNKYNFILINKILLYLAANYLKRNSIKVPLFIVGFRLTNQHFYLFYYEHFYFKS